MRIMIHDFCSRCKNLYSLTYHIQVLEIAMGGFKARAKSECALSITGADCGATLNGKSIRLNEIVWMNEGDELELAFARDGARAYVEVHKYTHTRYTHSNNTTLQHQNSYVCVQGGVDVPKVLNSRSTDVRAGFGKVLGEGDVLGRGTSDAELSPMQCSHDLHRETRSENDENCCVLRLLPGPGDPSKGKDDDQTMLNITKRRFKVTPRTERMACVLTLDEDDKNEEFRIQGGQQISEPCVQGTVQIPPDGNPVILMSESQTTGGYRVGGVVSQADMFRVAQLRPGDSIRFEIEDPDEAVKRLKSQHERATQIEPRVVTDIDVNRLSQGVNQMVSRRGDVVDVLSWKDHSLDYVEGNVLHNKNSKSIDLNADVGEGFDDYEILRYVTSVNVACGTCRLHLSLSSRCFHHTNCCFYRWPCW